MEKELSDPIFSKLKSVFHSFSPPFKITQNSEKSIDLYTTKEAELLGRKYPSLYFAGIKIQKGFVGFYYFPIYVYPELLGKFPPELKKCLKGKTCFHIKKDDAIIFQQINAVLKDGFAFYKKKDFI